MSDFQYSFRSYDALDLSAETQELFDVRDNQLENYLKNNNTTLNSLFVPNTDIRYGSAVVTLPAVGATVDIIYSSIGDINISAQFDSTVTWSYIVALVTNGDYPANPARFAVDELTTTTRLTRIRVVHEGGGTVGGSARVNFVAFGIR